MIWNICLLCDTVCLGESVRESVTQYITEVIWDIGGLLSDRVVVVMNESKGNCCRDIDRAMNTYIYSSQSRSNSGLTCALVGPKGYIDILMGGDTGIVYNQWTLHMSKGCCSHSLVCQWRESLYLCI